MSEMMICPKGRDGKCTISPKRKCIAKYPHPRYTACDATDADCPGCVAVTEEAYAPQAGAGEDG